MFRGKRKLEGKQGSSEKWMTWVKKLLLKLNLWSSWSTMKKPTTQTQLRIFVALSLTESLQIQVEWKQHMCFVHAHYENTSSIKINFKFLTISLFHCSFKQPFSFQQVLRWAWYKLNMHLKLYYISEVFSDWISFIISVLDWLKTFPAIGLFVFNPHTHAHTHTHTHAVSCWRKWFLFLTWTVSLGLFMRTEAATETCSLKI